MEAGSAQGQPGFGQPLPRRTTARAQPKWAISGCSEPLQRRASGSASARASCWQR
jgi:hypothetical protein